MSNAAVFSTLMNRPQERRPYRPFGGALRLWRSGRREVLLAGPANTGKTRAALEKMHFCADKYKEMRGLMVRKSRESLTQTAMVTYEKKVLPEGWMDNLIHFSTVEQQYEYPNGSIIAVGGLDKSSKLMSSEYDMIYVPEATELMEDDWQALTTRLRNHVMPYQQLMGDCNPGPPTHWLKRRCDRGVTLMLESRHEDNPACTDEDLATLDALTGIWYLRLRKGKWAAADGMVYEEWNTSAHKVSRATLTAWGILQEDGKLNRAVVRRVVAGVDWGYTNPGVILVGAFDGDGRLYIVCEVYRTQRTDSWWVEQAQALTQEFGIERFICDPSEPANIRTFEEHGLVAEGADNAISQGISAVKERLVLAGDGRPRLYYYEYALRDRDEGRLAARQPVCTDQEMDSYVWPKARDGSSVKEVPVKVNDHGMDALRYLCRYASDQSGVVRVWSPTPRLSGGERPARISECAPLARVPRQSIFQKRGGTLA
jgi:phage terminase large subunit